MYKRHEDSSLKIVINQTEQNIIDNIRKSVLRPEEIAEDLNKRGIFKKKKQWNASMVRRIRKN